MVTEARRWLALVLSTGATVDPDTRAEAMVASGFLSLLYHRDPEDGERYMERALHLAAAIGNKAVEMRAYSGLGSAAYDRGDYVRATEMYTSGQALARDYGDPGDVAIAANNLGLVAWQLGHVEETLAYWEESVLINAGIGDTMTQAQVESNLGAVKNDLGRVDEAREHLLRALDLQRSINNHVHLAITLINCGQNAVLREDFDGARAHYEEARDVCRDTGHPIVQAAAVVGIANVDASQGDPRQAALHLLDAIELYGDTREPMRLYELVETTASVSHVAGLPDSAAELLAAATSILGESAAGRDEANQGSLESTLRAEMSAEAFDAAWQQGMSLDFDSMRSRARVVARRIVGRRVDDPEIVWPTEDEPPEDREAPGYGLTSREGDVLRMLCRGMSTQAISVELALKPRTVSSHIANMMAKMGVSSRTAAVARALRDGVVSASDAPAGTGDP